MRKHIIIALLAGLVCVACQQKSDDREATMTSGSSTAEKSAAQAADKAADPTADKANEKAADTAAEKPVEKSEEKPAAVSYGPPPKAASWAQPTLVKVQHILIGVSSSPRPIPGALPLAEAKAKAEGICDRVRAGEDINKLMKEFSSDPGPGIYSLTTSGGGNPAAGIYPRSGMVKSFGDVAFQLDVGECAIAAFDPANSPFGFHVIKRLE